MQRKFNKNTSSQKIMPVLFRYVHLVLEYDEKAIYEQ